MKKYWLAAIAALVILALTASLASATTYTTITVDGDMSDWQPDELLETDGGGGMYVTWDAANLYIGLSNVDVDTNGVLFVYFDTIPGQGTVTGFDWNGIHTLPFAADFAIAADSGGNLGWLTESVGSWTWNAYPAANYVGWSGTPNSEFEVPRTAIGSPDNINVMAFFQNQADNGVTASWPTPNPANNSGSEVFTHHYHFASLVDGQSPDDSVLADHVVINEFDNYAEWIELYNPTAAAVDISGWLLTADYDSLNYTIPGGTILPAGGYWTYVTSSDLNNGGDIINLHDASAVLVDQVGYGNYGGAPAPSGDIPTAARVPNGTDTDDHARDWNLTTTPTQAAANDVPAVLLGSTVLFNEFDNYPVVGGDKVEIYNPTGSAVLLTDWILSDGDYVASIISAATVPAGGWLTLEEGVDWTGSMDWSSSDVGYIFRPDGIRVDQLGWAGEYENDTVQRICDGEGPNDGYDWVSSGGGFTLFDLPATLGGTNTPGPVDMAISKVGPGAAQAGQVITYVVEYWSNHPFATSDIQITETLPTEVTLLSWESDPPLTAEDTDPLWWDLGQQCGLPSGVITITVQVTDTVLIGQIIQNEVQVESTEDIDGDNDTATWDTVISPDLTIYKGGPDDPLRDGDTISYTLDYVIDGAGSMLNVTLTDTYPIGFALTDFDAPAAWACTPGVADMVCTAATLDTAGQIILTGTVTLAPPQYLITNTVEIAADNDGNTLNNLDTYENLFVMPIQDIQYVPDPATDDASPYVNQHVWIEGIVTADGNVFGTPGTRYFIEDPAGGAWSGIYIYNGGDKPAVAEGDWVELFGLVDEYSGVTQLNIRDGVNGVQQVISTTNPLPAPEVLATSAYTTTSPNTAEPYESVLIEFQAATVTDDSLGYGEWMFDDGSGHMRADDWSNTLTYAPSNGDYYQWIRGIGNYSYGDYKLVPRYDADINQDYFVTFTYYDPENVVYAGEDVYLAGDFNGWNASATALAANGDSSVFSVTVTLDAAGIHEYKYVVKSGGDQWDWLNTGNRQVDVAGHMSVDDYRNVSVGYAHLIEPPTITLTLGDTTPDISGEVFIQNVTDPAGAGRGVSAELGYGTDTDVDLWDWAAMDYTGNQNGNNDIYTDTITPMATGVYSYAVRFDGNWAPANPNAGWTYGDLEGVWPGNPFKLSQTGVLTVVEPLVTLMKEVTPTLEVGLGSVVTYELTLANDSEGIARGVVMTDEVPAEVTFGGWVQQSGAVYASGNVTWTGDLSPGESVTVVFTATLGTDYGLYGQTVTNTAEFITDNDGSGSDEATFTAISAPALTILKEVEPTTDVPLGATVTYSLTLHNGGGDEAVGVMLTDVLPSEVDFGGWIHRHQANVLDDTITWNGEAGAGQYVRIVFTATVGTDEALHGQMVTNTVEFDSANDGSGSDDVTFTIVAGPDRTFIYLPIVFRNN